MTSGGARNRSGPPPDPDSGRSETRGYSLEFLPAEGYDGPDPQVPATASRRPASARSGAQAWRTPQACAWSLPSERWRWRTVATWVRLTVRAEAPDAPVAVHTNVHRYADQIGMTTAGLPRDGLADLGGAAELDTGRAGTRPGAAGAAAAATPLRRMISTQIGSVNFPTLADLARRLDRAALPGA